MTGWRCRHEVHATFPGSAPLRRTTPRGPRMRPVMLLVAALLTSPALAGAVTGEMPLDQALMRYLVVSGLSWLLLTIASEWVWSTPGPSPALAETAAPADDPSAAPGPADG